MQGTCFRDLFWLILSHFIQCQIHGHTGTFHNFVKRAKLANKIAQKEAQDANSSWVKIIYISTYTQEKNQSWSKVVHATVQASAGQPLKDFFAKLFRP